MKSKKAAKSAEEPEAGFAGNTAEEAAKPRARKKAAVTVKSVKSAEAESAETPAKPAKKAASKSAAKKQPAKSSAAAEHASEKVATPAPAPVPAKKRAAKTIAKGRDLVADVPAVEEVAELLHETAEEALAGMEKHAAEAREAEHDAIEEEEPAVAIEDEDDDFDSDDVDDAEDEDDADDIEDEETEDDEDEDADEKEAEPAKSYEAKPGNPERLQKVLAKAGIASRRAAEEMILAGRVQINGKIVTELGTKAELGRDHIRVDGKLLQGADRIRYFVLNKPKGYVTTVSDPENRPTVMQFFAGERERLYPVGRLDYLSEGLLLVTNDGELANKLTKAANGVEKTYLVKVAGSPSEEQLDQIRGGMVIERGRIGAGTGRVRTAPAQVRKVREGDNPWYEVILIEGRNREIRKLFEEIGFHVEKIRRVGYGPLVLDLEPGKLRELDEDEVHKLRLTAEGKLKTRRRRGPAPAQLERKAGRAVQHEKFGKDVGYGKTPPPRKKTLGDAREERPARPAQFDRPARPAQFDRPDRSARPTRPAQFDRPEARTPREASTGQATGRRDFKPARPTFGDRPESRKPGRPSFPDRPVSARSASGRPESTRYVSDRPTPARSTPARPTPARPVEARPAEGQRPASPARPIHLEATGERPARKPFEKAGNFSKPPFDRDRGPSRPRPAGGSRDDRKPFRPARPREEFRDHEPEEFGAEPIPRTPGFRVEPVPDAPRAPRPPRAEFFAENPAGRPAAGKPFRSEGSRPASGDRPTSGARPFRKPEGRPSSARPTGRPAGKPFGAAKPYENRPARPFRERDEERGTGPRSTGERPSSPRPSGPGRENREGRGEFRPRRNFGDGEERPRSPRPAGRPSGPGRPRTGDRPGPAGGNRPRPFGASGPAQPGSRPKREEGEAPRVKNRWRNSFEGKNKGRPKPKKKD